MPESKTYKIGFYTFGTSNDFEGSITDYFQSWIDAGQAPTVESRSTKFELRRLSRRGNFIRGFIGKLRFDDLPHASRPGGQERELNLDDDEGLIEKNFFIYSITHNALIYQHQGYGSTYLQFGNYLTEAIGDTVSVNPIIQPDALRRLMRGNVEPKMVELSIAKPAANFLGESAITREIVSLMNSSEGMQMYMRFSLGRGRHTRLQRLSSGFKDTVAELMDHGVVSVARFHVSEDGDTHPIDLLTDRITDSVVVELSGRYPAETDILHALIASWNENQEIVLESIGHGENAWV
ncbi:hypothetical protein A9404_00370 [Halothiobacillus diazotrophicus]|uniref:Uncharacterized protein n=1 Tax=Halothiobacillus diazotrophicus TaxID=1860122 RepID=A0A191ZDU0_9GAMM|nr:DUF6731 family protein [Halothiobacillus diazotrophicus]ANJ66038.1 hypothetical protein A9404_00370 [Halothiobacillus diazotrophicus]